MYAMFELEYCHLPCALLDMQQSCGIVVCICAKGQQWTPFRGYAHPVEEHHTSQGREYELTVPGHVGSFKMPDE